MTQAGQEAPHFGVIGAGIRGAMFARAIQQNERARLVAVCDPQPTVLAATTDALGVPGYASPDELLAAHPELTAAVVATPDFAHRSPVLACLERGLDLFVEKPLATSSAEAAEIETAARASGARVVVGFENRWNPTYLELHDRLASGTYGTVINQVINLNDTIEVPTRMLSWAAGSSPAWFLMPHTLDLAIWLSGAVPVDVVARGRRGLLSSRGVDSFDAVTATFTMSDESLLVLNSQWVLPESMPTIFDFRHELHTEQTSIRLSPSDTGVHRHGPDGAEWILGGVREQRGTLRGPTIDMIDDTVELFRGVELDLPSTAQGRLVTDALEAVHRSIASGGPERIETADA